MLTKQWLTKLTFCINLPIYGNHSYKQQYSVTNWTAQDHFMVIQVKLPMVIQCQAKTLKQIPVSAATQNFGSPLQRGLKNPCLSLPIF